MRCVEILLGEDKSFSWKKHLSTEISVRTNISHGIYITAFCLGRFVSNMTKNNNYVDDIFLCVPESGADPTIESDSGFNAMDMAVAMGHRNGMLKKNKEIKWS